MPEFFDQVAGGATPTSGLSSTFQNILGEAGRLLTRGVERTIDAEFIKRTGVNVTDRQNFGYDEDLGLVRTNRTAANTTPPMNLMSPTVLIVGAVAVVVVILLLRR